MNFIADTPEDVSGWVEGKKNIIRTVKTLDSLTRRYIQNCEANLAVVKNKTLVRKFRLKRPRQLCDAKTTPLPLSYEVNGRVLFFAISSRIFGIEYI